MQSSQWGNFLCSWTDGHRIVSPFIQISLLAIVNITTITITINFLFTKNLLKYVTFILWNINSQLASLTCVTCHCWLAPFISVLTVSVLFQTIHLLLLPNWKMDILLSYKLLFYILYKMTLIEVEHFFKYLLPYIISGSCIVTYFHPTCSNIPNFKIKLSLYSMFSFSDPICKPQSKSCLCLPQYTLCWLVGFLLPSEPSKNTHLSTQYTVHREHLNLNPWPGTFKGTTLSCSSVKG